MNAVWVRGGRHTHELAEPLDGSDTLAARAHPPVATSHRQGGQRAQLVLRRSADGDPRQASKSGCGKHVWTTRIRIDALDLSFGLVEDALDSACPFKFGVPETQKRLLALEDDYGLTATLLVSA
eukprot:8716965-Pyramimonas_sp.AAC.1